MVRISELLHTPGVPVPLSPASRILASPEIPSPPAKSAELYTDLLNACERALRAAEANELLDVRELADFASQLVRCAGEDGDRLLTKSVEPGHTFSIARHGVHVAILTVHVGQELQLSSQRLEELALAGLLNDIGMVFMRPLVEASHVLGASQLIRIREHPWLAHKVLGRCKGVSPAVRDCVLQEHERIDGSGYPRRLSGARVSEDAQLLGMLDLYEALTHDRPHRRSLVPADAMRTVVEEHRSAFRDDLLRGLLRSVPLFPAQSWVELATGETGQVVRASASAQLLPRVKILKDASGSALAEPIEIDLVDDPSRSIARAVREPADS